MTQRTPKAIFLERQAYKRRRMRDLARAVPLIGAVLLCIPLLWVEVGVQGEGGATGRTLVYVYLVWVFLICLAAIISRAVKSETQDTDDVDHR